jgi:hypothetical protein
MPKSLTSLELHGTWICTDFLTPASFHVAQTFPLLENLRIDIAWHESLADWIATFPLSLRSLEVLEVQSWTPLPASLTSLVVHGRITADSRIPSDANPFPKSLLELSIDTVADWSILLRWLPLSLRRLTTRSPIPMSLESFTHLERIEGLEFLDHLNAHFPVLTALSVYVIEDWRYTRWLPPTLMSLEAEMLTYDGEGEFLEFAASLPRGLLNLRLGGVDVIEGDVTVTRPVEWPPGLQTMQYWGMNVQEACLVSLPKTITSLAISCVLVDLEDYPRWPALKKFGSSRIPDLAKLFFSLARFSPQLESCDVSAAQIDILTVKVAHSKLAKTFEFGEPHASTPAFSLGKALTEFGMLLSPEIGDEILKILPASVTRLYLTEAQFITDWGVEAHLSRISSLTELHLVSASLTGTCFKFFPKRLVTLLLGKVTNVSNLHFGELPKSLRELHLKPEGEELSDACGAHFPPFLESINISQSHPRISPEILQHLPARYRQGKHFWNFEGDNFHIGSGIVGETLS